MPHIFVVQLDIPAEHEAGSPVTARPPWRRKEEPGTEGLVSVAVTGCCCVAKGDLR
jgi:hypothetical protein